ncbi:uncharacterized protein LOC124694306 [Lolium rigidum]|uniref:uncharacterized protein LOC124694306 n=1 Tax=Lolium rigidum TaxID=89674 RepID=UPI001F5CA420|nr:uncharacterized protein LOC124694306 [Lolium rigidum]
MATAWVRARSLSCKSRAVADEVYSPPPLPKKHPLPPVKSSVEFMPVKESRRSRSCETDRPAWRKTKQKGTSELATKKPKQIAASPARPSSSSFLAMTELPEGHSSRRILELIFASGWSPRALEAEVEALFRVHSTARAVARFEDARAAARARGAAADDARCAADGNEVMRFQCRPADGEDSVICAAVATTKLSAVRTFDGSGAADASATGGTGGRRSMLVCRVIAGRVRRAADPPCRAGEYQSVDAGGGELVVLDRRAVLPCFLVVYRVKPALDDSSSSCRSR